MNKRFSFVSRSLFLFGLLCTVLPLRAGEIQVYAAASLSDALKEMAPAYQKTSGDQLILNLAASSLLARQIQEGAPADLFISADEAKMDFLEGKNLIKKESRKSLLSNTLALIVTADCKLSFDSIQKLADQSIKKLALAEPQTVPAGIYAKSYLQKTGVWSKVIDKVIPVENVRAVLSAVESGNVDAGIVYKTDALISGKVRIALEISAAEGPKISYPIAVIQNGKNKEKAAQLLAYLESDAALDIFKKYGFLIGK